jgi:hypothetical protein
LDSIDQSNEPELGHQVKNMANIYKNCTRTLIWLGPDNRGYGKIATNAMEKLLPNMLSVLGLSKIDWSYFRTDLRKDLDGSTSVQAMIALSSEECLALNWFYCLSWFSRLWVIQEFRSSPAALSICGYASIDAVLVAFIADWISQLPVSYRFEVGLSASKTLMVNCAQMALPVFSPESRTSMSNTLWRSRKYHASDVRDRIYSMLYMLSFSSKWKDLPVSYAVSPTEVYKCVMDICLNSEKSLSALSYIQSKRLNRPTWLPRWDDSPLKRAPLRRFRTGFKASKGAIFDIPGTIRQDSLIVRGLEIDQILESKEESSFKELGFRSFRTGWDQNQHAQAKAWDEFLRLPTNRYIDINTLLDVYSKVMCCMDNSQNNRHASRGMLLPFILTACGEHFKMVKVLQELEIKDLEPLSQNLARDFVAVTLHGMKERKLFVTNDGYFGLGPRNLEKGDRVCILFGANVPFILRPEDDHYLLIGECYCHEMMFGEMIDWWKNGDLGDVQEKEFVLH